MPCHLGCVGWNRSAGVLKQLPDAAGFRLSHDAAWEDAAKYHTLTATADGNYASATEAQTNGADEAIFLNAPHVVLPLG